MNTPKIPVVWFVVCLIAALGCVQSAYVQQEESYEEHSEEEGEGGDEAAMRRLAEEYEASQAEQATPPRPPANEERREPPAQPSSPGKCTPQQVVPPAISGGCRVRLVTPAQCEVVDLRGGRTYEVAWTTDGTRCETPWTIKLGGDPLTEENISSAKISMNTEAGITSYGGILYITARDLDSVKSSTGLYHWTVASFYGSHPGSNTFQVLR